MSNESDRYIVPGVVRALEVLEYLGVNKEGATLTELVRAVGYNKNSLFRITHTLVKKGYLARESGTNRFYLTGKLQLQGFE